MNVTSIIVVVDKETIREKYDHLSLVNTFLLRHFYIHANPGLTAPAKMMWTDTLQTQSTQRNQNISLVRLLWTKFHENKPF